MRWRLSTCPDAWRNDSLLGSYQKASRAATGISSSVSARALADASRRRRRTSAKIVRVAPSRCGARERRPSRRRRRGGRVADLGAHGAQRVDRVGRPGPLELESARRGSPARPPTASSTMRRRCVRRCERRPAPCAAGWRRARAASRRAPCALAHLLGGAQMPEMDRVEGAAEDADAAGPRSLANLAVPVHVVLVGGELAEAHRPARVQAVRADADLGAEAELEAVGEARRGVDEDRGGVDLGEEALRRRRSPR